MIEQLDKQIDEMVAKSGETVAKINALNLKKEEFNNIILTSQTKIDTHRGVLDIVCEHCVPKIKDKYELNIIEAELEKARGNYTIAVNVLETVTGELEAYENKLSELRAQLTKKQDEQLAEAKQKQEAAQRLQLEAQEKQAKLQQEQAAQRLKEQQEAQRKLEAERKRQEEQRKLELEQQRKQMEFNNKVNELQQTIKQCDTNTAIIDGNMEKLNKRAEEIKNRVSPFEKMLNDTNIKLNDAKDELVKRQIEMKYQKMIQHVVSEEGVKRVIIEDLAEILNNRVRYYLAKMGTNYICTFDTNFDVEFLTTGGVCTYKNFSGGEKARINVATLLAFMDLHGTLGGFESSTLNIDELLDSALCANGLKHMMGILKEMVQNGLKHTINVISHKECMDREMFDNLIDIVKENNITKLRG
jgi:DNA repair exonuclease SbcCD ATPase subunit